MCSYRGKRLAQLQRHGPWAPAKMTEPQGNDQDSANIFFRGYAIPPKSRKSLKMFDMDCKLVLAPARKIRLVAYFNTAVDGHPSAPPRRVGRPGRYSISVAKMTSVRASVACEQMTPSRAVTRKRNSTLHIIRRWIRIHVRAYKAAPIQIDVNTSHGVYRTNIRRKAKANRRTRRSLSAGRRHLHPLASTCPVHFLASSDNNNHYRRTISNCYRKHTTAHRKHFGAGGEDGPCASADHRVAIHNSEPSSR
ncbi:hypothetical protein EVAR_53205_1 [Eumeta japonica]|uniref:Uncharacterized protein n=1 Tax=Eumeta variegata TaxID=151549 RepID=A0A4C1XDL7_EUMVA|nr:hypothetical protein EVAR_53205_1 [Eumeta japonica]